MASAPLPEIEILHQLLVYEADTGLLIWKPRPIEAFSGRCPVAVMSSWNARNAGREALTSAANGYKSGTIYGRRVMAHKVAWAMHYGEWPLGYIDHINGNRTDNRIENLRCVTPAQNQWNARGKMEALGRACRRGAHWHKSNNKWSSSIRINLGYFDSEDEAADAYERAAKMFHGRHYLPNGDRTDS